MPKASRFLGKIAAVIRDMFLEPNRHAPQNKLAVAFGVEDDDADAPSDHLDGHDKLFVRTFASGRIVAQRGLPRPGVTYWAEDLLFARHRSGRLVLVSASDPIWIEYSIMD